MQYFAFLGQDNPGVMKMTEREYGKLVQDLSPKSPMWRDCLNAFWIGGLICVLGQLILNGYTALGIEKEQADGK